MQRQGARPEEVKQAALPLLPLALYDGADSVLNPRCDDQSNIKPQKQLTGYTVMSTDTALMIVHNQETLHY